MYAEKLKQYKNVENLGGKAWEHAVTLDLVESSEIANCSLHYFHYQQMFELLFKHLLETRTTYGAYPRTHKLNQLLLQLIDDAGVKIDSSLYFDALNTVTVCAEAYRYTFLLDYKTYKRSVAILNPLLDDLVKFANNE